MQSRKLWLSLFLLPLLSGCDGGASYDVPGHPRPVPTNMDRIAGTWRVRSYAADSVGLQQCPSTTLVYHCTDSTRWSFRTDGSMTDANGATRTFTFNGTTLEFFGKPDTLTITVTQLTDTLMAWDMTGVAGVPEKVALLFEKQ